MSGVLSLTDVVNRLRINREGLAKLTAEYRQAALRFDEAIQKDSTTLAQIESGLDAEKILLAEHVIRVGGLYANGGVDRESCLTDAINDIAAGGKLIASQYFGTKNYDRWSGQRCDCEYGMGPRHGNICFEIGLTREARQRTLTPEETEAAVYYLLNLQRIQSTKPETVTS